MKRTKLLSIMAAGLFCLMLVSCDKENIVPPVVDYDTVDNLANGTENIAYIRESTRRYLLNTETGKWELDESPMSAYPHSYEGRYIFQNGKVLTLYTFSYPSANMIAFAQIWGECCRKQNFSLELYVARFFEFDKYDNTLKVNYEYPYDNFVGKITEINPSRMTIESLQVLGSTHGIIKFVVTYLGSSFTDTSKFNPAFDSEKEALQYVLDEGRSVLGDTFELADGRVVELDSLQRWIDTTL